MTAEVKAAMYATTHKCGDIVAGVEVIGGGVEKGTRDVPDRGGGPDQEKPEEAAEEKVRDEAEADGGVGPGKEVGQGTSDNQGEEPAGEGVEAEGGTGLGKEAAQGTSDNQGGSPERALVTPVQTRLYKGRSRAQNSREPRQKRKSQASPFRQTQKANSPKL